MISFKDFYFLKENPDKVINTLPDGREVKLKWENNHSYSFGFFNPDTSLDVGNLRGKMVIEDEGTQGYDKLHAFILMKFLKHNKRTDIIEAIKNEDARQILNPAGRIWVGVPLDGNIVNIISFWAPVYEVKLAHIKQILNRFILGEEDYDKTFVEFVGKDKSLTPLSQFKEISKPKKISKQEQAEIQRQQSEKHIFGGNKNPDFGSKKQARDADKAGERSYAEYKQKQDPHGFHGESYKP